MSSTVTAYRFELLKHKVLGWRKEGVRKKFTQPPGTQMSLYVGNPLLFPYVAHIGGGGAKL